MARRLLRGLAGTVLAAGAGAAERPLGPDFVDAGWRFEGDAFGCTLVQENPRFGPTVFHHEAGEALALSVPSPRGRWQDRPSRLAAVAPVWAPGRTGFRLRPASVALRPERLTVHGQGAERLLTALVEGLDAVVEQQDAGDGWAPRLRISGVRIRDAYPDFLACRETLLPVNFRQAERTRLPFAPGALALTEAQRERLAAVAEYVRADASVRSVYVDGYTDNRGTRPENLDLSRQRALRVAEHLVRSGVAQDMLVTRYHGERFPVADNDTPEGRARNRRVTVRLEKPEPEIEIAFAPGFGLDAEEGDPEPPQGSDADPDGSRAAAAAARAAGRAGPASGPVSMDLSEEEEREILDALARTSDSE